MWYPVEGGGYRWQRAYIRPYVLCEEQGEEAEVLRLVMPVTELQPGQEGRIAHIAARHHTCLDRLTALGLFPGNCLRVHQVSPAFVIRCGETNVALDREVAQDIYVRRIDP